MRRTTPLVTGQYYHVFNRTIEGRPLFVKRRVCDRTIDVLNYYRFADTQMRFSYLTTLSPDRRVRILDDLQRTHEQIVHIIAFTLMPNHFHLLLKQTQDGGISKYLSQFENSITRYFNIRQKRRGYLFEGQFKAVRIETEAQLLHVNRYIHINPTTSFLVRTLDELLKYEWSSLPQYMGGREGFCKIDDIMSHFNSPDEYLKFISDNIDYQRRLASIKHLLIEEVGF